ncbi:Protein SGT1 [Tolypocladium paradoxum]|uniref:Protein SGT1 n=1 Tax=Tolypocladium paradoxum TaxID=94208 RepID=A0A2S4KUD9_9HYPO|nr:Protein SGT1 [Tolypocladium paradoxum]
MSHLTIAQQGLDAVEAKRWNEAVGKLSTAIKVSTNPAWLLARSKALVKVGLFEPALDDASLAWLKAHERNQRPLMRDAHYRRAVAYFRMGKLADADCCCVYAMRLIKGSPAVEDEDPKTKWTDEHGLWTATLEEAMEESRTDDFNRLGSSAGKGSPRVHGAPMPPPEGPEWRLASALRMQALRTMGTLPEDDPRRKVTASQVPVRTLLKKLGVDDGTQAGTQTIPKETPPLRLQDFQNNSAIYLSIFSKGVDKEKLKVKFLSSAIHLDAVVYPNGEEKDFRLELWDGIVPTASKYVVTPNKIELTLAKRTPGKWPQIRKEEDTGKANMPQPFEVKKPSSHAANGESSSTATKETPSSTEPVPPESSKPTSSGLAYPSSSRTGPKDWDKIGADEPDDEERDVNFFFKKLYKNATPEQQRAMAKSFTESSGTSLSTDWEDVKGRKVATVPPEGVEEKKWE